MNILLDLDFNLLNEFCGKTDDELAVTAKTNKQAASTLVFRYSKLIFVKAGIYASNDIDTDDLRQEGLMGLLKAIASFDIDKGVKFSDSISEEKTPESIYINKEFFSELWHAVNNILSETERKVFSLYIQGMSYREIASKCGISEKTTDNAIQRAKNKIRAYIGKY